MKLGLESSPTPAGFLPDSESEDTPMPEGQRPSSLPPIPESGRRAREHTTATRLSLDRILESARRIRAEEVRAADTERVPDTQRCPVWTPRVGPRVGIY